MGWAERWGKSDSVDEQLYDLSCYFRVVIPIIDLSSRATGVPNRPHLPDGVGERGICSLMNIKPIARKLESTDGAEIAEAALVLPLVFMLLLGIIWFGRAFNIYSTIQQAAQQGAITAARASCATCGNRPPIDDTVDRTIYSVMQASSLDPTQIPTNSNPPTPVPCVSPPGVCTTANNITICRNVQLNPTAGNTQTPQCGTVVGFQYPFQFYLPFTSLNMQRIILSAQAQSRMEN
jgi:Flp pilus assembly protein TadG